MTMVRILLEMFSAPIRDDWLDPTCCMLSRPCLRRFGFTEACDGRLHAVYGLFRTGAR